MTEPSDAVARFDLGVAATVRGRYGDGHINDTFLVDAGGGRFLLQAINPVVFPRADELMANVVRVLDHLAARAPDERSCLRLVPTVQGGWWWADPEGVRWRVYRFIEDTLTFHEVTEPGQAWETALAFARFQTDLSDLPGGPLTETIAGFHDTVARVAKLQHVARVDPLGRLRRVRKEIEWALGQDRLAGSLVLAAARGVASIGVSHGDAKVGNLLLNAFDHRPVCVVDLDTVMQGIQICDVGEIVRTATCPHAEDHADPLEMEPRRDLLEAVIDGWMAGAGVRGSPEERELLTLAGAVMAFENGVRFLTDWIEGDVYYKVLHEEHNLERARTQLALARSLLCLPEASAALSRL